MEDQARLICLDFKLRRFLFRWHCDREGGNSSVVHNLIHVGHCLLIAVEYAQHHHPFLRVLWFGHISFRSRSRSWLVISDRKRLYEEDVPRLRSFWIRLRVGILRWHSNSSCSLLVFLSLVPFCVLRLFSLNFRKARHVFVRAFPSSSM